MSTTLAYFTSRKECHFDWWVDSLKREIGDLVTSVQILVVDHWSQSMDDWTEESAELRRMDLETIATLAGFQDIHVLPPKPNVYQGKYRLCKDHWWAACIARNTAIALAKHDYIVFCDDLSIIVPGWWAAIMGSRSPQKILCGAYQKVKKLQVENGKIISCDPYDGGRDHRMGLANRDPYPCEGGWLYGASFAAPTEALLAVNGFDENAASLSSEDYLLGIRLANAGYQLLYDRRMMTIESEEGHHSGPVIKRRDKGVSPNDKSHAILNMARGSKWAPNYFGEGGLRALRQHMLAGGEFPIMQIPEADWFDGQKVSEF